MSSSAVVDLVVLRTRGDEAIARLAAAPVLHVPDAFVAALRCVTVEELHGEVARPLRAVR